LSEVTAVVAHQFDDAGQQQDAATLGMWIFLATEVMFFGGLFAGYAYYRSIFPAGFAEGSRLNDVLLGGINTAVLISSSLTMALAVRAAQLRQRKALVAFLACTMLIGAVFLGIKFLEYFHHYQEHLIPGSSFTFTGPEAQHVELFICFYFGMTGLHALHMVIGLAVLSTIAFLGWRGRFTTGHFAPVEVAGLYWHFVDLIWIFLYPLLYLVDLHK